ncbi:glutamate--cysteine ligase [Arthrobacter sp. D1-17]
MRSFGVEEEFLLVDARTGVHAPVGQQLVDAAPSPRAGKAPAAAREQPDPGRRNNSLRGEVQLEQVEAVSAPFTSLDRLADAVRAGRVEANRQALAFGALAVAVGTSPLPDLPRPTRRPRYEAMEERFGLILREQLMCGFHIHVSISSAEEGVAVLDGIRIWLPLLIAMSTNSPFWLGQDTGYASFRYQVWRRWPTAGPTEVFGSAQAYNRLLDMLLSCNVLLDGAMVYFDARLSATYPTVEVRVPDVCLDADHAIAIAAVARALVETAARDWARGNEPPAVPAEMLRLASWRASRFSLDGDLIHPLHNKPRPAKECLSALLEHIRPALTDTGDFTRVHDTMQHILANGTGAHHQRRVLKQTRNLRQVILNAAQRTTGASGATTTR